MSIQSAAEIQVLLEGVSLPAKKRELVDYALREDEHAAAALQAIPDREYRSLDEIGEALASVQPAGHSRAANLPREESGEPPGGDSYVDAHRDPGAVRPDAPPWNPPEKVLEQQSKIQEEQAERRKRFGAA